MQDSHVFNCNAKSQEANKEVARLSASLCGGCMMDYCGFAVLVTLSAMLQEIEWPIRSQASAVDNCGCWHCCFSQSMLFMRFCD